MTKTVIYAVFISLTIMSPSQTFTNWRVLLNVNSNGICICIFLKCNLFGNPEVENLIERIHVVFCYSFNFFLHREKLKTKLWTNCCSRPRRCCQDSLWNRRSWSSMTDTKVKYTKQELIYTSRLHTGTVLDHCMLVQDLLLLSDRIQYWWVNK